jgi:hypothetical protein
VNATNTRARLLFSDAASAGVNETNEGITNEETVLHIESK